MANDAWAERWPAGVTGRSAAAGRLNLWKIFLDIPIGPAE